MSWARRVDKPDANTAPIVEALREAGAKVWYMSRPADLLVYARDRFMVVEVKNPENRRPRTNRQRWRPDQLELLALEAEDFAVVETVEEAIAFVFGGK